MVPSNATDLVPVQSAVWNAVVVAVPVSAAVLPAAWPGTRLLAVVPCGTAVARVAVLAAGTPARASNNNRNNPKCHVARNRQLHI